MNNATNRLDTAIKLLDDVNVIHAFLLKDVGTEAAKEILFAQECVLLQELSDHLNELKGQECEPSSIKAA